MRTFEHIGLKAAYRLFAHFHEADPAFEQECHSMAHELGNSAQKQLKEGTLSRVATIPDLSYCNYGFFHGLLEAYLWDGNALADARALCDSLESGFKDGSSVLYGCLHGFGHGIVDGTDPSAWGDEEALLRPAISACSALTRTLAEKANCISGGFHALEKLSPTATVRFDADHPFTLCEVQTDPAVQKACYTTKSSLLYYALKPSMPDLEPYLKRLSAALQAQVMTHVAHEAAEATGEYAVVAAECYRMSVPYQVPCLQGIVRASILFRPKDGYAAASTFCLGPAVRSEQRDACMESLFAHSVQARSSLEHKFLCLRLPHPLRGKCLDYLDRPAGSAGISASLSSIIPVRTEAPLQAKMARLVHTLRQLVSGDGYNLN